MITLRDANRDDAAAIGTIYNDVVRSTKAIWNDREVTTEDREAWMAGRKKEGFPVIVAVDGDNRVLGYATFGYFRAFEGYRLTVEHSVHIHRDSRGKGIGTLLMTELILRARKMGKHVMVAAIEAGNTASIRLHEKLGFERVGQMNQVGLKFGQWLDLALLELRLDDRKTPQE